MDKKFKINKYIKHLMLYQMERFYYLLLKINKLFCFAYLKIYDLESTKLLDPIVPIVEVRGHKYYGRFFHKYSHLKSIFIHTTNIQQNSLLFHSFNCDSLYIINLKFKTSSITYRDERAFKIKFHSAYIHKILYLDSIYPGVRIKKDRYSYVKEIKKINIKKLNWNTLLPNRINYQY